MHSPDPKSDSRKKKTSLKDKKDQLSLHLYKGSLIVSAKSTNYTTTATISEVKPANRFEQHSLTRSKSKPFIEPLILHQAFTSRYPKYHGLDEASGNVDALISPRYKQTNPITNSGYPPKEWKSSSKKTAISHKTTLFTEEEKPRGMAKGKFHDETRTRWYEDTSPEPPVGLRTFKSGTTTQSEPEPERRQLRFVATSPERNKPNPITEGEDRPIQTRVVEQQVSEHTQKMNEKKAMLPCERVLHSPNRRNLQKPVEMKQILEQEPLKRRSSNVEVNAELNRRKSGTINQFFDHSQQNDSKFKTAVKISDVEYKTIQANLNTDRTFGRVKADPYV